MPFLPFKPPLDVYFLAVPMACAVGALATMVVHTLRHDPDQSQLGFYEHPEAELAAANAYHNNPAKRYFNARATGRQTWGVFDNDFSSKTSA